MCNEWIFKQPPKFTAPLWIALEAVIKQNQLDALSSLRLQLPSFLVFAKHPKAWSAIYSPMSLNHCATGMCIPAAQCALWQSQNMPRHVAWLGHHCKQWVVVARCLQPPCASKAETGVSFGQEGVGNEKGWVWQQLHTQGLIPSLEKSLFKIPPSLFSLDICQKIGVLYPLVRR